MLSRSASFIAICLTLLLSTSTIIAEEFFVEKGEGVCVDSAGAEYDYIEAIGVASASRCQSICTSHDTSNLRGIEYEAATQACICLYENEAGFPVSAFSDIGSDSGAGSVAGSNSTFSTFQCYSFSGSSYSLVGTGGCIDSSANFFSYGTPLNAQGIQTADICQSACTAAKTYGLVGIDYDGECYCLYTAGSQPSLAFSSGISTNSGTGAVAGVSTTVADLVCHAYVVITPSPTAAPTGKSSFPSSSPSKPPSASPAAKPSVSFNPSNAPSGSSKPSISKEPSVKPSSSPSIVPSKNPSSNASGSTGPSRSMNPSSNPSGSARPSVSKAPSRVPSASPSIVPSKNPSSNSSGSTGPSRSMNPSSNPSGSIRPSVSEEPSTIPSISPSLDPSADPSRQPSRSPSKSHSPSKGP